MIGLLRCAWRDAAVDWIDDNALELPWPLPTGWRPMNSTEEARFLTIETLRATPDDLPPSTMGTTSKRAIFIEWRNGLRELRIEVRADATLEVSALEGSEAVEELYFEESRSGACIASFAGSEGPNRIAIERQDQSTCINKNNNEQMASKGPEEANFASPRRLHPQSAPIIWPKASELPNL